MKVHPLRVERERRGWSQARVAEALGVSNRTVTRWELRLAIPYPYYREQLAQLFGKSVRELDLLPPEQQPGSPPSPAQEPAVALAAASPPAASPPSASPPPSLLLDPAIPLLLGRTTSLVGRAALLAQIKAQLFAGKTLALSALGGLPGVGKTALAVALSLDASVQAHFADGILWAGLGPQPDRLGLLTHWGTLLGVRASEVGETGSWEAWGSALRASIGSRRLLLVIDDAWSAQEALSLQVGGPNCAHLLTTRSPQVAFAFAQAESISVPELSEQEGLALLARFVPQVVQQEWKQAASLVRAVSGLPLALSLVGKYLASQSLSGQPRRLRSALAQVQRAEQRLRLAVPVPHQARAPHLPDYVPLSLQATIAVSEGYLSQEARACWYALAVFPAKPNSFSEEAALAVSQQGEVGLDGLWDAGLLESSGPGRYSLHQTIADYARARGEQAQAQARLVSYMLSWLQGHEGDYELVELEASNLLAALEAAIALGMQRELIAGIDALVPFLERRGRYELADQYLQQAYEAAVALAEPLSQMRLLEHLAHFAERRGEYQQAERYGEQGLELARAQDQLATQSALLTTLTLVAIQRGEYARALSSGEQGLQLARQVGASERICSLLDQLSWIAIRQGRHEDALELAHEGLELARRQADEEGMARLLNRLAHAMWARGDTAQAEALLREGLALARHLGYRELQAIFSNNVAEIECLRGDYEQAEALYLEALVLARQIGEPRGICTYLMNLGDLATLRRTYVQAERYLLESLELARQADHGEIVPFVLAYLGEAVGYQGDEGSARTYFEESLQLARQFQAISGLSEVLVCWGGVHLHFQRLEEAEAAYQEVLSLQASGELEARTKARAHYGLARVAGQRGEMSVARRLGQESRASYEALGHHQMAAEVAHWMQTLSPLEGDAPPTTAEHALLSDLPGASGDNGGP
jgi:tetratricopeptide (TPR) repeat protein/transcriptional regulator with XRE-family HTH domain